MLINGHRVPIPLRADTGSLRPMKEDSKKMKTAGEASASVLPSVDREGEENRS